MAIIWSGGFERGSASFKGNTDNEWLNAQIGRPAQLQAVTTPKPAAPGTYCARVEVKHGDTYSSYSDDRALLTGPGDKCWFFKGQKVALRLLVMLDTSWLGAFPKQDELMGWISDPVNGPRLDGGSFTEWHHDMGGAVETGSAPIYLGADDKSFRLAIIDQDVNSPTFSAPLKIIRFAPPVRGKWLDLILWTEFGEDFNTGAVTLYAGGGKTVLVPRTPAMTIRPGSRASYLSAGLYRRGSIGDTTLLWPAGPKAGVTYPPEFTPKAGARVYPRDDGYPGIVYLDGFMLADTVQEAAYALSDSSNLVQVPANFSIGGGGAVAPPNTSTGAAPASANALAMAALLVSTRDTLNAEIAKFQQMVDNINVQLDKGPP